MADITNYTLERQQLIDDWAKYTAERLQKSLLKKKVGQTGSLNYSLLYQLVGGSDVSSVLHTFNYYGKFVDMGAGKGQKLEDVKGNADLIAMKGQARRPKKWFSKTYYAEITELRDLLQSKYGEQSANIIKESIEKIF